MITDLIMAGIVSQKRRDGGPGSIVSALSLRCVRSTLTSALHLAGVSRSAVLVSQCLAFAVLALLALTIMPWAPGKPFWYLLAP